jgi:hypothetical protein
MNYSEMSNEELSEAVARAQGDNPSVRFWMMNAEETGYSIDFDTMGEAEKWQRTHPEMCRNQHIVRREFWRKYAKDIAAAWELVEELYPAGYFARVSTPTDIGQPYTAKIDALGWGDNNPPSPGGWWSADTAPRAICLAWLEWKASK